MVRSRRFLFPALVAFAALLLAAPASALPASAGAESGWLRFLEPLFRLFAPQGWAIDPNGRPAAAPTEGNAPTGLFSNQGWLIDPDGLVSPPPSNQGAQTPPNA